MQHQNWYPYHAMSRFILRYRGVASPQTEDLSRIRALPNTTIVDASTNRMILVDAPEEHLRRVLQEMPGWMMVPEQTMTLPDPREKVLHPPDENSARKR